MLAQACKRAPPRRYVLRVNFRRAESDSVVRAGGTALFSYHPHIPAIFVPDGRRRRIDLRGSWRGAVLMLIEGGDALDAGADDAVSDHVGDPRIAALVRPHRLCGYRLIVGDAPIAVDARAR